MRHVLFVDDEPAVLSGLRRMLHSMRSEWRMTFSPDAASAIAALEAEPADVVIADMRMPGRDGASLLTEVRTRWPETVRIILSGFADEGAALRSVPVAHQFLSKPCDSATVVTTVSNACELQARLSRPELRSLVGGIGSLPSAPRTFTAITEAFNNPSVSLDDVATLIEQDPGSAAKLLQLVNSAFFGIARKITVVREAVAYLGLTKVRDVALAVDAAEMFRNGPPQVARIAQVVNDRSLVVAGAARELAPRRLANDAFVAGVLHDIGQLALASAAPDRYLDIWREDLSEAELCAAELAALGATHADLGGHLLRLWGLPFPLVEAVARHADPEAVDDPDPVVAVIATVKASIDTSPDVTG